MIAGVTDSCNTLRKATVIGPIWGGAIGYYNERLSHAVNVSLIRK